MEKIKLDYSNVVPFIKEKEINKYQSLVKKYDEQLKNKTGLGNEFTQWVTLPRDYDKEEYERIKQASDRIIRNYKVLLVIGIGGSYLGARAVIEALTNTFSNTNSGIKIYYTGNNLSDKYILDLVEEVKDTNFCINVVSKSGTTIETAICFRIFKEILEKRYGKEEARNRIFATTDKEKGILKQLADKEGYETFVVPDEVGGRYSVLTAVGLLPIAVAGLSIDSLFEGAYDTMLQLEDINNDAYKYAVIRNILYKKGKEIELLVNYEPSFLSFAEWWKQLFGETEGKDGKGIFPASVINTSDLHSMGQLVQEGKRNLFETVINIEFPLKDISIGKSEIDIGDGLKKLEGMQINYINKKAMEGTIEAHVEGNVPNILINVPELSEYYIGALIYFFEKACAMSGYLLGVNPFNQPGVQKYKKNMFRLLGKD